jgi:Domain of unknown function (DUF4249)
MKKNILIAVVFSPVLFFACTKNLNIDIPEHNPRLVFGFIQQTGENLSAQVSKSRGILAPRNPGNPNDNYRVTDAQVLVYANNILFDTLKYNVTDNAYTTRTNKKFLPGINYRVTAIASGFNMAEGTAKAPLPVSISGITRIRNARTNADGQLLDDLVVNFTDPANERNYYMIRMYTPFFFGGGGGPTYLPTSCIYSNDIDIDRLDASGDPFSANNCLYDDILIKDDNFNGRQKQLKISVDKFALENEVNPATGQIYRPYFELLHITESHYKYLKSLQAYDNTVDNPFAEPALVYTNITNGYGVFGIYTSVKDSIR